VYSDHEKKRGYDFRLEEDHEITKSVLCKEAERQFGLICASALKISTMQSNSWAELPICPEAWIVLVSGHYKTYPEGRLVYHILT